MKRYPIFNISGTLIGHMEVEDHVCDSISKGEKLLLGGEWSQADGFRAFVLVPEPSVPAVADSVLYGVPGQPNDGHGIISTVRSQCKRCHTTESALWWKCCPRHTTERGSDVMCTACAAALHLHVE